ncbi:MAG: DUF4174 domain-containing protein [Janthinobacterium lividum]
MLKVLLLAMIIAKTAWADQPRRLYIYAPTASDPALIQQRHLVDAARPGLAERDLVLIEIIGKRPHFEAVLVGKDGGEKLRAATPLTPERLFETIDAMPLRLQERRRQELRQR